MYENFAFGKVLLAMVKGDRTNLYQWSEFFDLISILPLNFDFYGISMPYWLRVC